jgi:hypothetical protein
MVGAAGFVPMIISEAVAAPLDATRETGRRSGTLWLR